MHGLHPGTAAWPGTHTGKMTCDQHPGVQWFLPTYYVTRGLTPPCFICDPGWWVENPPPSMTPERDPDLPQPETVMDLVREFSPLVLDRQAPACQLDVQPDAPGTGGTTAKEATE